MDWDEKIEVKGWLIMFSKVGNSLVEVVGMIYGGKETKALEIGSIITGVPWEDNEASFSKSPSPMLTFTSVSDTFVMMSEVHTSS